MLWLSWSKARSAGRGSQDEIGRGCRGSWKRLESERRPLGWLPLGCPLLGLCWRQACTSRRLGINTGSRWPCVRRRGELVGLGVCLTWKGPLFPSGRGARSLLGVALGHFWAWRCRRGARSLLGLVASSLGFPLLQHHLWGSYWVCKDRTCLAFGETQSIALVLGRRRIPSVPGCTS